MKIHRSTGGDTGWSAASGWMIDTGCSFVVGCFFSVLWLVFHYFAHQLGASQVVTTPAPVFSHLLGGALPVLQ